MATALVRGLALSDAKRWKGGHIMATAPIGTAMPTRIEDILDTSTFALKAPWVAFGATTDDGFTVTREWDTDDGLAIDQRDYEIDAGGVTGVTMGGSCTVVETDSEKLRVAWELGASTTQAASSTQVAAVMVNIGNPETLTRRRMAIIQMNTKASAPYVRMFVFRQAEATDPGELNMNRSETSTLECNFTFQPDTTVVDGTDFGLYFEQTGPRTA